MKYGPMIFFATLLAMSLSWFAFVLTPQIQVGQLQATNVVGSATYPVARSGLARQGAEVYRQNGCAYCHSQQVGQEGTLCEVVLTDVGTNQPALIRALLAFRSSLSEADAAKLVQNLPQTLDRTERKEPADRIVKGLTAAGAKAVVAIVPIGSDIARGWGKRRTVAQDFLYDEPVMLGSQRVGPDLANMGIRLPDYHWHMRHLYAPRAEVKGSIMPPYRFLFEKRRAGRERSPEALVLPAEFFPGEGWEILPTPEAKALVVYLLSLRADAPLFSAPLTVAGLQGSGNAGGPNAVATNAPASGSTNSAQ